MNRRRACLLAYSNAPRVAERPAGRGVLAGGRGRGKRGQGRAMNSERCANKRCRPHLGRAAYPGVPAAEAEKDVAASGVQRVAHAAVLLEGSLVVGGGVARVFLEVVDAPRGESKARACWRRPFAVSVRRGRTSAATDQSAKVWASIVS